MTSTNQTWWVCRKCGKEFVEKEAAREIADSVLMSSAVTTGVISILWQVVHALAGYSSWVRNIALLAIAGTWMILPEQVKGSTGYSMQQLMVHEERVEFYKKCAFYGVIISFLRAAEKYSGYDITEIKAQIEDKRLWFKQTYPDDYALEVTKDRPFFDASEAAE